MVHLNSVNDAFGAIADYRLVQAARFAWIAVEHALKIHVFK